MDLSLAVCLDAVSQRKHPANPLLSPARPWEVLGPRIYGGVVPDAEDGLFRMWYTAGGKNKYDPAVAYPSGLYPGWSADGLHWEQSPQPTFVMADGDLGREPAADSGIYLRGMPGFDARLGQFVRQMKGWFVVVPAGEIRAFALPALGR